MRRTSVGLVLAIAVVVALAAALVGFPSRDGGSTQHATTNQREHRKTYAELVAANYKVLTPKQSHRLLRFAEAFHACMTKRLDLGAPESHPTKIVMALPAGAELARVAQLGIACGTRLGDPPPGASLQIRKHSVVLYLPKYCLLDRKVVASKTS